MNIKVRDFILLSIVLILLATVGLNIQYSDSDTGSKNIY